MDDDWDLQAVVRGCTHPNAVGTGTSTTSASWFDTDPFSFPTYPPLLQEEDFADLCCSFFPDLLATPTVELEELYKPFYSNTTITTPNHADHPSVPLLSSQQQQKEEGQQQRPPHASTQMSRSKRRKSQQKRVVCQVPAEGLSSDMWAWRKYGQKPIKGSPYPRGYYRCSSSKGCLARKQVERSRADPAMFIITYASEHNHPLPTHRNSLAGSTRHKYPENAAAHTRVASTTSELPKVCSPLGLSPRTTLSSPMDDHEQQPLEEEEEKDELVGELDLEGEDGEMFMDLEELEEAAAGAFSLTSSSTAPNNNNFSFEDCFGGTVAGVNGHHHLSSSPWLANSNGTATAASGR